MSGIVPKPCEIIVSNDIQLSKDESNDSFIRFSTEEEFGILLLKYDSSKLILACTEDTLNGIAPRLNNPNLDIIYVLTQKKEIPVPLEVIQNNCQLIEIRSKKELIRNLFTKSMLYYFDQGRKYKKNGDFGLANLCFTEALTLLNRAEKFR